MTRRKSNWRSCSRVNPYQPEALAYRAVIADLRNETTAASQYRADALKFYPRNPRVDYLIGLKLSQNYRFAEGAAAQRRALDFEPDYLPAQRQLAEDLLRLGQDDEGWALAESVHSNDEYDVTAYNLSVLHDEMDKFATLTNANFIVHMSGHEAGLYGDQVLDLLSRARETSARKYGVKLTQPTTVEIFPATEGFCRAHVRDAGQSRLSRRLLRLRHHGQQPRVAGGGPGELGGRALARVLSRRHAAPPRTTGCRAG